MSDTPNTPDVSKDENYRKEVENLVDDFLETKTGFMFSIIVNVIVITVISKLFLYGYKKLR